MKLTPRFDRIFPLITLVVLGLMVVFLLESNPDYPLVARISNDLPVISVAWFIIALLVIIISTGADLLAKAHPALEHRELLRLPGPLSKIEIVPLFWVLPSAVVVGSFAFFRLFQETLEGTAFILVLVVCGSLLTGTLVAQHYVLDRNTEVRDKARVGLQAVAYLVAFGMFSAIANAHYRMIFTGILAFSASVPLAYRLLARNVNDHQRPLSLALTVVGVVIAEAAAMLSFWPAPFLIVGTLLTALFYVMMNLLHHAQAGTLDRRIGWELGIVGAAVFVILTVTTL